MAYFNPYYNQNRYTDQSDYKPYGYVNNYKPQSNPQGGGIDYSKTMQVPGMSFNLNSHNSQYSQPSTGQELASDLGQTNFGKSGGNMNGKIGAGVAIASNTLGNFESAKANANGFDIDNMAGLKGAGSGAAAGSAAGPWGALIGAIGGTLAGSIGTVSGVNKNVKALNTTVNGVSYDQDGKPVYQGQDILNASTNSDALTHGIHQNYNTSDITGTRWIGEAIYNTRKTMRRKRAELDRNRVAAQNKYNAAQTSSNQQYIAQQDYQNSLNNNNRMYNLYS